LKKSGLHKIDLGKAEIQNFRLFKDIDYPEAWSILEDNRDNLWDWQPILGCCGLSTITGQVKEFTEKDGCTGSIHDYNVAFKTGMERLFRRIKRFLQF